MLGAELVKILLHLNGTHRRLHSHASHSFQKVFIQRKISKFSPNSVDSLSGAVGNGIYPTGNLSIGGALLLNFLNSFRKSADSGAAEASLLCLSSL